MRLCRFPGLFQWLAFFLLLTAFNINVGAEPVSYDSLQVYFSPQGGCQQAIADEIARARKTLDIAMFAFTNRELANAVIAARKRGVEVRVVLDASQAENRYSKKNYLLNKGVPVRLARGRGQGIMHHKFAVIDDMTVITGSFNWTAGAEESNFENLLIFHSPVLALKYADEFRRVYGLSAEAGRQEN